MQAFIFEVLCYSFALAAYSEGSKLFLSQAYHIFNPPSINGVINKGHIMGTSQFPFMIIFRISTLAETLIHADTVMACVARITLLSIEEQLVDWHVGLAVSNDMDIGSLNDAVTSKMYFLACRIYLRKVLDPCTPDEDATIQDLVWEFIVADARGLPWWGEGPGTCLQ